MTLNMETPVLPALYLPPISFFQAIKNKGEEFLIEQYENFPKQTFRNRASIYAANGKLDLIIPLKHEKKGHKPMKDIKISYDFKWQRLHWLSIQSAYRSSAYFEYYEDEFAPFYEKNYTFLLDYNVEIIEHMLKLMKAKVDLKLTDKYWGKEDLKLDFRDSIHPKKEPLYESPKYYQVFEDKEGFIKGLSMVDLLFNQGPRSWELL